MPPPPDALQPSRFGGVSGLAFSHVPGELLGICDEREDSRLFVFRFVPPGPGVPFRVDLHAYSPLPQGEGAPEILDGEGIALTAGGRLFIASEGAANREPRVPPAVVEYTRGYRYVGQFDVPDKFLPNATGPLTRGVRDNAAFESLTITPGEDRLYTATESALVQDGEPATMEHGATARILEYDARGGGFVPGREFAYPLEPMARPAFPPRFFVTGLVELVSLGGTDLLAMERGFADEGGPAGRSMNQIRIYRISLDGATDVSGIDSLRGRTFTPVRKSLLLDLSKVKGLSRELAALDNFEGMTLGPPLPDGSRTLVIVSDDNFNPRQRTAFLLFRLPPDSGNRRH
jgi:hypothetical protein